LYATKASYKLDNNGLHYSKLTERQT